MKEFYRNGLWIFFETFNEMFIIGSDNLIDDDLYNNEIKINRPRFLELSTKIFKKIK